jgi:hypothetical protein
MRGQKSNPRRWGLENYNVIGNMAKTNSKL